MHRRDVDEAVELGRKVAGDQGKNNALAQDALAAALARSGQFDDAVEAAGRAADIARSAGQADLARSIDDRLKEYRAGKAYIARLRVVTAPATTSAVGTGERLAK